ncbi:YtpI family protein [Jeotgalibacillus terrae]|uniref:YtpI family protein n=1 Tax=Jeotgalibacillus terrae TaxID=587735 RepID=A0ABW5ZJZ9_9BACL|nr:YtpI family protein [Jeotgalibacillus terrae]MBM7578933.1 amino acid transporter [Jeotgalibacillus terrae]
MAILVFLIIMSGVAYLYFKTKQIRTPRPAEKAWQKSRAGMALGALMGLVGLNTFFLFNFEIATNLIFTYIIALLFIIIGFSSAWIRYKAVKHFTPLMEEEDRNWNE